MTSAVPQLYNSCVFLDRVLYLFWQYEETSKRCNEYSPYFNPYPANVENMVSS